MRRDSQPGHVTTRAYARVFPRGCASVCLPYTRRATDAPRDIRLRWRGRERTPVRADARTCAQGMDRRSRASLPPRPSPPPSRSFLLVTPLVSRFLPPLASLSPPLSPLAAPVLSFTLSRSIFLRPAECPSSHSPCPDDRRFNVRDLTCLAYLQTSA